MSRSLQPQGEAPTNERPGDRLLSDSDEDASPRTEDAQSKRILRRAQRADKRREQEEKERREAVLAERRSQMSKHAPPVPATTTAAKSNGDAISPTRDRANDLHLRVLKEAPLTGEQLRRLHLDRRRQMIEYADATRQTGQPTDGGASGVTSPKRSKRSVSKTPAPVVSEVVPPLVDNVKRGNDYMYAVAREQRERREKLLERSKVSGDGKGDTLVQEKETQLEPAEIALAEETLRRKRMLELGCGYLREQREAAEKRRPLLAERERAKLEREEQVEKTLHELQELKRIGHRLQANELYKRHGKKLPYSNLKQELPPLTGAARRTHSQNPSASSSPPTVLPPIPTTSRRTLPPITSPEDVLIKSAHAKIRMLQLLSKENGEGSL